jgi:hypothetical protein
VIPLGRGRRERLCVFARRSGRPVLLSSIPARFVPLVG